MDRKAAVKALLDWAESMGFPREIAAQALREMLLTSVSESASAAKPGEAASAELEQTSGNTNVTGPIPRGEQTTNMENSK